MYKVCVQALALFVLGSLITGCSVSEKITAKFRGPSKDSSVVALDEESTAALKNSKDLKNPTRVHFNYAQWKEETGDLGEAEKSYRVVLNMQPEHEQAKLGLARVLMQQGRVSDAGELFQAVLKKSPDNPAVLLQVAQYYSEQSQWNQSAQMLKRAAQLDPQNKDIHFHYAVALANLGDSRGAYNEFRTLLSERDSHYNLGKICHKRGDMISAQRHFEKVLQIDPEFQPAQEMMARIRPSKEQSNTQYVSYQRGRSERRAIPASAERTNSERSKPFKPVFEYSEEVKPAF